MADDTIADRNAIRPAARAAVQPQPDGSYISQVGTTQDKFTDGFNGSSLDLTKWDVLRNTGGMTLGVAAGALTIGMGTTAGAELLLVAKQDVTIPANLVAVMSVSQRIAGNYVSFGYLEVDPDTGAPVAHAVLPNEFRNSLRKIFDGTGTSSAKLETMSTDAPAVVNVVETLGQASNLTTDHALFARAEDVTSVSQASNSTSNKASGGGRISTQCPSPNRVYRPFIHLRNTASAPATATSVVFQRFVSIDIQELEVQASMGQGVSLASAAIPVILQASGVALNTGSSMIGGVGVVNSNSALGGSNPTPHHRTTTADTNVNTVKGGAGKVFGGRLRNKAAYEVVLKFYNKATTVVIGTDTPFFKIAVPAGQAVNLQDIFGPAGLLMTAGISYAVTQLEADNDTTAVAAGDLLVALIYG